MAEAVGLALAIAPLVVSATEHYSTAAKAIKRYRLYTSKREELISKVKIQRAIFRRTIWRLLAYDIGLGEAEASQMLIDAQHPAWSDAETRAYFDVRMAGISDELTDSIHMINDQLALFDFHQTTTTWSKGDHTVQVRDILLLESQELRSYYALAYKSKQQQPSTVDVRSKGDLLPQPQLGGNDEQHGHRRKKLQFAMSEEALRLAIENLRILTKDFRTLVEQTAPPPGRMAVTKPGSAACGKVAKYAAVKTAANDLYHALGLACTKHTAHQAHLSLTPTYGSSSQIRFTIAFGQTIPVSEVRQPRNDNDTPMWLTVESQVNGIIETTGKSNLLDEMKGTLKRPADAMSLATPVTVQKKVVKKSVKFHLATDQTPGIPLQPIQDEFPPPTTMPTQNLCTHSNFCNLLQNFLRQPLSGSTNCIGYLECSGKSKHLVYMKSKEHSLTPGSRQTLLRSLREVYDLARQGSHPGSLLPLHRRICLAKELAIAVLQFHETPWLLNSICSDDVLLPGSNEAASITTYSIHEPYVDVSIKGSHGPLARQTTLPSRTLIRNRLLFSLGVMLLELAYQAPLQSLQKDRDVDANVPANTDYHIANRVRLQAADLMGPKYAEVVRKCIQCDFGCDDDLGETRLQEGFHQDVICKLEELEDTFRGLSLAI